MHGLKSLVLKTTLGIPFFIFSPFNVFKNIYNSQRFSSSMLCSTAALEKSVEKYQMSNCDAN